MPKNSILGVWWVSVCQWSHERFVHAASYTVHQRDTKTASDCALLALGYPIQLSTSEQNSSDPTDHSLDTSRAPPHRMLLRTD